MRISDKVWNPALQMGLILCLSLSIVTCVPPTDHVNTNLNLGFNDPVVRKVLEYQDKGLVDSLYPMFLDKNPGVRFAAVRAFASIKNDAAVDSVIIMLKDPVLEVRAMAAYALGQIASTKAETSLIAAFTAQDPRGVG